MSDMLTLIGIDVNYEKVHCARCTLTGIIDSGSVKQFDRSYYYGRFYHSRIPHENAIYISGIELKEYIDQGQIPSDRLTMSMLMKRVKTFRDLLDSEPNYWP